MAKKRRRRDFTDQRILIPYVRQSRARINETSETALSLEAQETQIREWGERNGFVVEAAVRDHDEDSETDERDGIDELYRRIRPGVTVGVELWDRMGRGWILEMINAQIEKRGGQTVSITQGGDRFSRKMHGVMGGEYLEQLSDRLHSVTASRVHRGVHVGATPYGYDRPGRLDYLDKTGTPKTRHTGLLEPHSTQAPIVRRIFARWIAGDSLRGIAVQLNAEHVPSPGEAGWVPQTLSWLIRNPVYAGAVRMRDETNWGGIHVPLIDRETWDAAQVRFARVETVKSKDPHWAEGLVSHVCNARMTMNLVSRPSGKTYPSYRCTNNGRIGPTRCVAGRQHIGAPLIDKSVRRCLTLDLESRIPIDDALARAWAEAGGRETIEKRAELEAAKAEQIRQRTRAGRWFAGSEEDEAEGAIVKAEFDRAIRAIEREIARLPAPPDEAAIRERHAHLASFAKVIKRSPLPYLREMVTLLGTIRVTDGGVMIDYWPEYRVHFDPHTVDPDMCSD